MRKKVLITSGVFPPDIGGPARMIEQLVLDLREKDFEVEVLTFGQNHDDQKVHRAKNKIDFIGKIFKLAPKFDVIYTFDLYTAGFFSWLIGKIIFQKKLIVRFAGDSAWELASNRGQTDDDILIFQNKFYGLSVAWQKLLRKWIVVGADRVIAVSEFMKKVAIKIGVPSERITVIYNSVDFTYHDYHSALPRSDSLVDHKMILTVGRLVPWKGVDLLIKALAKIKDNKLKLWIVGDGPDRSRSEKLAQDMGVDKQVEFKGKVPLNEVSKYYYLADVFVLDSQYEGLSHVLLEALRAAKPIITSKSGGNPEVIEDGINGLLIDYGDVQQLADSIQKMLVQERWRDSQYRDACRASLQKFNWKNVVSETIRIINEVKQ